MDISPIVMANTTLPFGTASLIDWHWPSPMDFTKSEDSHMIELSLPPLASEAVGSFPDMSPHRFTTVGNMFVRPAGVAVRVRSVGGHSRVVRLAVEPAKFAEFTDGGIALNEDVLHAALNLRAEAPRLLMRRIRDELVAPGFASAALVEAYGSALMIETARALRRDDSPSRDQGRLAAWQYNLVRARIEEEATPPTMSELAGLCGVSVRHSLRLYRARSGESVTAYISRVQLSRASALLEDEQLSLKEIAIKLGFAHPGSFSAAFRRSTGASPSEFRQLRRSLAR